MDLTEQLRVLQAAQGDPAKLALATVDLAYPALAEAERAALKEALEAAATTHWCDEAILATLLEISAEESAVRLARLRRLSVVEPFPARAAATQGGASRGQWGFARVGLRDVRAVFRFLGGGGG